MPCRMVGDPLSSPVWSMQKGADKSHSFSTIFFHAPVSSFDSFPIFYHWLSITRCIFEVVVPSTTFSIRAHNVSLSDLAIQDQMTHRPKLATEWQENAWQSYLRGIITFPDLFPGRNCVLRCWIMASSAWSSGLERDRPIESRCIHLSMELSVVALQI